MKKTTIFHLAFGLFIVSFLVTCLAFPAQRALAQYPEPSENYSREELAQMLAPIALYPDALLSQILMASTYPIEVIEADRWLRRNQGLTGEALDKALLAEGWDPSVKAICHFPSILALMSERITETTNLGNAFLAQEAEVMDMVQELRAKAYAQGNLTTTSEQTVIVERETIIIEPADPRIIYVPYYDPFYIYGPWWYPAYPPFYWGPPGVHIELGIFYWPGIYFGFTYGSWCYFDWHHHYIFIDVHKRPRFVRHDHWMAKPGRWQHAPRHRRGVAYRDKSTARKYGQYPHRTREFGGDIRGFPERIELDRERERRVDGRTKSGLDQRRDVRTKVDRVRQEKQRVERNRQIREQSDRGRQERTGIDRVRRQKQQRVERKRPSPQRAGQERRPRVRVERERQQRSRDNVFNRVENGRSERQSSERGRVSRQGRGGDFRDKGRSGAVDRGDRNDRRGPFDRGRNRR